MTVPLVCVLIGAILPLLVKVAVGKAQIEEGSGSLMGYDNNHPRQQQAQLTGWGQRAVAAHNNAYEAFPPFAAGVIVCLTLGGDPMWTNALCITWVVSRLVYTALYLANLSTLRTTVWTLGFLCALGLIALPLLPS